MFIDNKLGKRGVTMSLVWVYVDIEKEYLKLHEIKSYHNLSLQVMTVKSNAEDYNVPMCSVYTNY